MCKDGGLNLSLRESQYLVAAKAINPTVFDSSSNSSHPHTAPRSIPPNSLIIYGFSGVQKAVD